MKKIRAFNQHKLEEFERYVQEKKEFVHQTTEEKVMAMKKGALGVKLSKPAKIQEDKFKFIFNKDNQDVFRMICKLKGFN